MAYVMAFSYDSRPIQTLLNQIREMGLIYNQNIKEGTFGVRISKISYYTVL